MLCDGHIGGVKEVLIGVDGREEVMGSVDMMQEVRQLAMPQRPGKKSQMEGWHQVGP